MYSEYIMISYHDEFISYYVFIMYSGCTMIKLYNNILHPRDEIGSVPKMTRFYTPGAPPGGDLFEPGKNRANGHDEKCSGNELPKLARVCLRRWRSWYK